VSSGRSARCPPSALPQPRGIRSKSSA
jgi:hypothetical protein